MILLPATLSARLPRLEFLGKYREPGILLAAGFLAGMLLFLLWLALLPPSGKEAGSVPAAGSGAAAQKPLGDADGVLNDITGGPELGQRGPQVQSGAEPEVAQLPPDQADSAGDGQDDGNGNGDGASSEPSGNEGDQLSGGLLDEPDQEAAPEPPVDGGLQIWYVEVMREPGMTEYLQVSAVSAAHARAILRDHRGDPEIIRGPSPRPLD